jgi:hypothetical protein
MREPKNSQLNTVNVPTVGTSPALLYVAADVPLRINIRNVGGAVVLLAHESTTLSQPPALANTYQLPPGTDVTLVLMPRQGVSAASSGAGGVVSIAVSEALPQVWMET